MKTTLFFTLLLLATPISSAEPVTEEKATVVYKQILELQQTVQTQEEVIQAMTKHIEKLQKSLNCV